MRLTAVALIFLYATPAFAWNALGHKVIAEIAWRELSPDQRQGIVDTLRRHPRFDADFAAKMTDDVLRADKATQDQWIFQHAATWPDLARNLAPSLALYLFDAPKPANKTALAIAGRQGAASLHIGLIGCPT